MWSRLSTHPIEAGLFSFLVYFSSTGALARLPLNAPSCRLRAWRFGVALLPPTLARWEFTPVSQRALYLRSWITSKVTPTSLQVNTRSSSNESLTSHQILRHLSIVERYRADDM